MDPDIVKCPKCATTTGRLAKYCPKCGRNLSAHSMSEPLIIFGGLLGFAAGIIVSTSIDSSLINVCMFSTIGLMIGGFSSGLIVAIVDAVINR